MEREGTSVPIFNASQSLAKDKTAQSQSTWEMSEIIGKYLDKRMLTIYTMNLDALVTFVAFERCSTENSNGALTFEIVRFSLALIMLRPHYWR